jgi:acetoin utilization deacetylase AcuC-like enzyme
MPLVYYSPRVLAHETGNHPEHAGRLTAIADLFDTRQLWGEDRVSEWAPLTLDQAATVHDLHYLQEIRRLAETGGGRADPDTVVSPRSLEVALLAAGGAVEGVRQVMSGAVKQALTLVRPPGHHALFDRAMGFCLLNNAALATQAALDEFQADRVLIVDWDVHHGNGTQDLFYQSPRVGYFSVHRHPFYPGTGLADETGTGAGLGTTRNLPMALGIARDQYLSDVEQSLGDFADKIKPDLVIVSAGFDAHAADPIGSLGLETEDFATLTKMVLDVAATHCDTRVVSLLEGGYNPPVLAECVALHLETMRHYGRQA